MSKSSEFRRCYCREIFAGFVMLIKACRCGEMCCCYAKFSMAFILKISGSCVTDERVVIPMKEVRMVLCML